MKKNVLAALGAAALKLGLLSQPAFAAAGWTSYGTVEEVYPNTSGVYFVRLTVASNPSTCSQPTWFSNSGTGDGASRVFAALLSAQASGKSVRVYVAGTCDGWGYSEISSASVIN
jgi:hypothetical protein